MSLLSGFSLISRTSFLSGLLLFAVAVPVASSQAVTGQSRQEIANQARNRVQGLLKKHCESLCELTDIRVEIESVHPDTDDLGFEALTPQNQTAQWQIVKLEVDVQIDDRVSSVNRQRLQKILETSFQGVSGSVSVNWAVVQMPQISSIESQEDVLLKGLEQNVTQTVQRILDQYCGEQCVLVRVAATGSAISNDEARSMSERRIYRDKARNSAIKVNNVDVELSFDKTVSESERVKMLNLIKTKLRFVEPVSIDYSILEFPNGVGVKKDQADDPYGLGKLRETLKIFRELAGTKEIISTNQSNVERESSSKLDTQSSAVERSSKESREHSSATSTLSSSSNSHSSNTSSSTNDKTEKSLSESDSKNSFLNEEQMPWVLGALAILVLAGCLIAFIRYRAAQKEAGFMMAAMPKDGVAESRRSDSGLEGSDAGSLSAVGALETQKLLAMRHRIAELKAELINIYSHQPRVAKDTFTRLLQDEGYEETSRYVHIFGPMVVFELLDDPTVQRDLMDLSEFYQKSNYSFTDEQTLDLLQKLRARTTASEIRILAQKKAEKFDFLRHLDAGQVYNLIVDEKPSIQSIVLTQLDAKKRRIVFEMYSGDSKVMLMRELSKATTIPKEFLFNVANALHKKVQNRPEFDSENIRSSDILYDLLEKADIAEQRALMQDLVKNNPEAARAIKLKLITIEVLPYLKDGHLLEIIFGMERADLLTFLVGTKDHIRDLFLRKAPDELAQSWIEDIQSFTGVEESNYRLAELKIINRIKSLANNGAFRLLEINERIFAETPHFQDRVSTSAAQRPIVPSKYAA